MSGFGGDLGEDKAGTQRHGGICAGRTPQGPAGTWLQAKGDKGGSTSAWEWRYTQASGAGRRDERRRLAGG